MRTRPRLLPWLAALPLLLVGAPTLWALPDGENFGAGITLEQPTPLSEIPRKSAISLAGYQGNPYMELHDPRGLAIRMTHTATSIPAQPVILYNIW